MKKKIVLIMATLGLMAVMGGYAIMNSHNNADSVLSLNIKAYANEEVVLPCSLKGEMCTFTAKDADGVMYKVEIKDMRNSDNS